MSNSNSAKHTPGPWYVSMGASVFKDVGDEAHLIASCDDWSVETKANARLIAAAPELLAALREWIDSWGDAQFTEDSRITRHRALIAKAGGAQ